MAFRKKVLSGMLLFSLGIGLVILLFSRIETRDFIDTLSSFPPLGFVVLILFSFIGVVCANWRAYVILKAQGTNVKFFQLLAIWLTGNAFNYLTPFVYLGGEGVKAYLLNERLKLSWDRTAAVLALDRILEISTSIFVIAAGIIAFIIHTGKPGLTKSILAVICIVAAAGIIVFLFYFRALRNKTILTPFVQFSRLHNTRFGKFLVKAEDDVMGYFKHNRKVFWKAWWISFLKQGILLTRQVLIFYFLGYGVHAIASLISLGAVYLGFTIPVPASLGVQETLQSAVFSGLGLGTTGQGVAFSFVLRGADIVVALLGFAVVVKMGINLLTSGARHVLKLNGTNKSNNE